MVEEVVSSKQIMYDLTGLQNDLAVTWWEVKNYTGKQTDGNQVYRDSHVGWGLCYVNAQQTENETNRKPQVKKLGGNKGELFGMARSTMGCSKKKT